MLTRWASGVALFLCVLIPVSYCSAEDNAIEYPVTAESERGSLPIYCPGPTAQTAKYRPIGPLDPESLLSGEHESAQSSALVDEPRSETLAGKLIRQSSEARASKAQFDAEVEAARSTYFKAIDSPKENPEVARNFAEKLFIKDLLYLSLYIVEGTTQQAQAKVDGILRIGAGGYPDGGIGSAWSSFAAWVDSARAASHVRPGELFIPTTPNFLIEAFRASRPAYDAYRIERDKREFDKLVVRPAPRVIAVRGKIDLVNNYFSQVYDPAEAPFFCNGDASQRQKILERRSRLRARIIAYENLTIKMNPENARRLYPMSPKVRALFEQFVVAYAKMGKNAKDATLGAISQADYVLFGHSEKGFSYENRFLTLLANEANLNPIDNLPPIDNARYIGYAAARSDIWITAARATFGQPR